MNEAKISSAMPWASLVEGAAPSEKDSAGGTTSGDGECVQGADGGWKARGCACAAYGAEGWPRPSEPEAERWELMCPGTRKMPVSPD